MVALTQSAQTAGGAALTGAQAEAAAARAIAQMPEIVFTRGESLPQA
jgi:hypothetical protein